jgi:hypothetical protein
METIPAADLRTRALVRCANAGLPSVTQMHMTSSVLVKSNLESAWAFLAEERNAARWDRSVARADLVSAPPLRVGSIVRTTAPSGMKQEFRVDEISAPHTLRFSLVRSSWFVRQTLSPQARACRRRGPHHP